MRGSDGLWLKVVLAVLTASSFISPFNAAAIDLVIDEASTSSVAIENTTDDAPPNTGLESKVDELANDVTTPQSIDFTSSSTPAVAAANEESQPGSTDTDPPEPASSTTYQRVILTQVQTTGGTGKSSQELIEIYNNTPDEVDITGWSIETNGTTIYRYDVDVVGKRIILPAGQHTVLASSDFLLAHSGFVADGVLMSSVITNANGSVRIVNAEGATVSGLSWGTATSTEGTTHPGSSSGGVLERKVNNEGLYFDTMSNIDDFEMGSLRQQYVVGSLIESYDACLNIDGISEIIPPSMVRNETNGICLEQAAINYCEGLLISEIGANITEQFIEVVNSSESDISLSGCRLATNRNDNQHQLGEQTLTPGSHVAILINDTNLTLTKTTAGAVYLLASDESEIQEVSYADLRQDTSWSFVDGEWQETYAVTPGGQNFAQLYPACEEGYERNLLTGRCNQIEQPDELKPCGPGEYRSTETNRCRKTVVASSTLTPCKPGQYRNPETNRCRSLASTASTLTPCKPGQYRNPETNRCKSLASEASTLKPCEPGYERNPETNRCRKVLGTNTDVPAAAFAVEPISDDARTLTAWWALGGVVILGLAYAGWEWRNELWRWIGRIGKRGEA